MIQQKIKQEIDKCVQGTIDNTITHLEQCYNLLLPHIQISYENSRNTIQFSIGQFQRISSESSIIQMAMAMNNLRTITHLFMNEPSTSLQYINIDWSEVDITSSFEKIGLFLHGKNVVSELNSQIADALSQDKRRKIVRFIIDSVKNDGLKTVWSKDTIDNHLFYCPILYSICKKDKRMDLFFYFYYNVLDRINSSGEHQLARDLSENLLIIGYNENLLAESYYGACRAYTLANNPIAGLLYMNIALTDLRQRGKPISQHFAFEIIWQILKLMRALKISSKKNITFITQEFNKLKCNDYDKLSFYYTAFTIRIFSKDRGCKFNCVTS